MAISAEKSYTIKNVTTGRMLNVFTTNGSAGNGSNVVLYTNDLSIEQQWQPRTTSGSTSIFKLNSLKGETLVLDRFTTSGTSYNNADVWADTSSEDNNQKVCFVAVSGSSNRYYIQLVNSGLYLCAYNNSNGTAAGKSQTSDGNVFWSNTGANKVWEFSEIGNLGNGSLTEGIMPSTLSYLRNTYKSSIFSNGQCTWHCWGRAREVTGKAITFSVGSNRDAKNWLNVATNCTTVATPCNNSIAVFSATDKNSHGHVVYIEKVENGNVWYTEANWSPVIGGDPSSYNGKVRKETISSFENNHVSGATILGYLRL